MKHTPIILLTLLLGLTFFGCKKQEQEILTPKIIDDKVETTATTATFTWTVDWPGKLISVVEVSENEDMSHSQIYGSETETENHNFTVTVPNLKVATKYYYRYLVWNKYYEDNRFVMDGKTINTFLPGLFSVDSHNQVRFSQGNLQYQASTNIWRFAENQYEIIGDNNSNISSNYSGWIDLFGWGTSGWNSGAECYQPWSTGTSSSNYYLGGGSWYNLTGGYANADWGVYNSISNGGNKAGKWRTFTQDEWVYVFSTRQASTVNGTVNARFVKAKVSNVHGVILFPDSYAHPSGLAQPIGINEKEDIGWNGNNYSATDFELMEQNGAVFLPAAGCRNGTSVYSVGLYGNYWSASNNDNPYAADCIFFQEPWLVLYNTGSDQRYMGYSVRLVHDAQ